MRYDGDGRWAEETRATLSRNSGAARRVMICGELIADFGDDVMVRVQAPRGSTVVQVAKSHIKQDSSETEKRRYG
jgi:hypothetical protein